MGRTLAISQQIDTDLRDYSMYILQNRAIPSLVDGFKTANRKAVFSALRICQHKAVKTAALVGQCIKDGFHHGDASMEGTVSLMAAQYCNNLPIFEGEGNFGGRFEHEAAAGRYTSVKLSPVFHRYFNDFELCPDNPDPEFPEPLYYLPIIPWVLVNGVTGVAMGFSTEIQPRKPENLVEACRLVLAGEDVPSRLLKPHYEGYRGEIDWDPEESVWVMHGKYEVVGSGVVITEIPTHYERSKYVARLNKLQEKEKIISWQDHSSKGRFEFRVRMKRGSIPKDRAAIEKLFGLRANLNENITVIGINGTVRVFETAEELLREFVQFRIGVCGNRIQLNKHRLTQELAWNAQRQRFIRAVLEGDIRLLHQAESELERNTALTVGVDEDVAKRLLGLNIRHLTNDELERLRQEQSELKEELEEWNGKTPEGVLKEDLDGLAGRRREATRKRTEG